jgi:hypothetical protein
VPEPKLYQIYYSEQSRSQLDPGFIPLDNAANERPDWREYWPIRRFLRESRDLDPDTYYGFFSPKFGQKTGLDAAAARAFIEQHGAGADVIAFSPYFDQIAFPLSILEQAIGAHGECLEALQQCATLIAPGFQIARSVTTTGNTIYCNFFAAKPGFWSEWLQQCERIFQLAEESLTPLGIELNRPVTHGAGTAPLKVFVIERVATLLLWAQRRWGVKAYDPASMPLSPANVAKLLSIADFSILDALKIAYDRTGFERLLSMYAQLRGRVLQRPASTDPAPVPGPRSAEAAPPKKIRIVCATRKGREAFFAETALGRSLSLYRPPAVEIRLFPENDRGLPALYNQAIDESAKDSAALLFMHDDLHLCDYHWADKVRQGLGAFDVIGLAGNRRRVPRQPGWLFLDERLTPDNRENLSGAVGHGRGLPLDTIDVFGPSGQPVKLLDGLFLAVSSETLSAKSLRFDERFDFHFYDVDFCRQAEKAGLRLGTWPISVVHESSGGFVSEPWRHSYESYLEKWGE